MVADQLVGVVHRGFVPWRERATVIVEKLPHHRARHPMDDALDGTCPRRFRSAAGFFVWYHNDITARPLLSTPPPPNPDNGYDARQDEQAHQSILANHYERSSPARQTTFR